MNDIIRRFYFMGATFGKLNFIYQSRMDVDTRWWTKIFEQYVLAVTLQFRNLWRELGVSSREKRGETTWVQKKEKKLNWRMPINGPVHWEIDRSHRSNDRWQLDKSRLRLKTIRPMSDHAKATSKKFRVGPSIPCKLQCNYFIPHDPS